jgi:hypothetical protein
VCVGVGGENLGAGLRGLMAGGGFFGFFQGGAYAGFGDVGAGLEWRRRGAVWAGKRCGVGGDRCGDVYVRSMCRTSHSALPPAGPQGKTTLPIFCAVSQAFRPGLTYFAPPFDAAAGSASG